MMNIPGNLIRGAGSVVGGTVSAVVSVAGGRRGSTDISNEITVKEKSVLTIKETPVKDAPTTTNLSILTGYLTKRNEQGIWQKRFCCLVPHMFLYYFDNDTADSPRGIIDLEYFTNLDIQNENVLRISTPSGVSARSFYFQIDDPIVMSQWMASLHRDRYMVIRDERDAYQQLQDQFSGQMDFTSKMIEEYSIEKDRLVQEISKGQKLLENLVNSFQTIFEIVSESDESDVPTINKTNLDEMASLLENKITTMKSKYEHQLEITKDSSQKECENLEAKIEELEKQLQAESHARRLLETQILQEKRENEAQMRDALSQIDKSNQNYQVVWGIKSSLEEKIAVTTEQKKVLIKEVKSLRKKVEEVGGSNEELRTVNGNLENAILELQKQLETQKLKFEALLAEASSGNHSAEALENDATTSPTIDIVQSALKASSEAKQHKGYASNATLDSEEVSESATRSHVEDSPHQSRPSRHGSLDNSSTSILPPPPLPVDLDGNVIEWDNESREKMLQMDWLSPEQRTLLQERQKEELPFESDNSHRRRSLVEITSHLFHLDKSEKSNTEVETSHEKLQESHEESKISFKRLSAIFHSSDKPEQPSTPPTVKLDTVVQDTPIDNPTTSIKPLCYRCGGTVEGPKYSTCKCDIPQMTPIVEESAIDQFKGLFSKGKNAAKKAGSAVTNTLLKGRNEEISTTESHPPPSSPHTPPASSNTATKKTTNLLSLDEPSPSVPPSTSSLPSSPIHSESSSQLSSSSNPS